MGKRHLVLGNSCFVCGLYKPEGKNWQGGTLAGGTEGTQEGKCPKRPLGPPLKE